jgi:hypothetical protein
VVVPVLPVTEHHAIKAYWGMEVQLHSFFDLCTRFLNNLRINPLPIWKASTFMKKFNPPNFSV